VRVQAAHDSGIIGLCLSWGKLPPGFMRLNQQVKRERERQGRTIGAPMRYRAVRAHSDSGLEQKAKAALEEASRKGLSVDSRKILQNYFQDLQSCYQGQRDLQTGHQRYESRHATPRRASVGG